MNSDWNLMVNSDLNPNFNDFSKINLNLTLNPIELVLNLTLTLTQIPNQLKLNFLLAQLKCHIKQQPARNSRVGGKTVFSAFKCIVWLCLE